MVKYFTYNQLLIDQLLIAAHDITKRALIRQQYTKMTSSMQRSVLCQYRVLSSTFDVYQALPLQALGGG